MNKMNVKIVLKESKKLLESLIESEDDYSDEEIESVKHFINGFKCGCYCDDYNGFDCGCTKRAFLADEAMTELENMNK